MEIWDAYDARGNRLGIDLTRGRPVPDGMYHLVAEVAVRHADGTVLVTQRDWSKPNFAGCWELGAGGSALKGEEAEQAARRELLEETGLWADALLPLFTVAQAESHCIYAGYVCRYDGPKDNVSLQPGETIAYRWLTPTEVGALMEGADFATSQRVRWRPYLQEICKEA